MKKIAVILMLIGFAVVCASQVEVELTLKSSNTSIRVTVPEGAFQMIDNQAMLALLGAENDGSVSKKAPAKKYTPAAWSAFESMSEYEQFRKLCGIDSPALSTKDSASAQGPTDLTEDMSKELFEKCLITANYLDIQGEYAERFSENMVKYGLFGKHSADIISSEAFSNYDLSHDTSRDLLYAFLRQAGFKYRITHPSTGQTMLRIEKAGEWPKKINKEYTGPSQTAKIRTVLHSKLGLAGTQEKERNEAVLVCLLLSIGGSSVDIQYEIDTTSEDPTDHTQTIKQFTKENEKGARVYVEGLTLDVDYRNNSFLIPDSQIVPGLSRLELSISSSYIIPNTPLSSLVRTITLYRSVKALKITGYVLESAVVGRLVESFPTIEQLCLWCKILEGTAIDSLKKCTRLERLETHGELQPSATVQALVAHLSSLKNLSIVCQALELTAAEAFQACPRLESLKIWGEDHPRTAVQELIRHLPFLRELAIKCKPLELATAESFQACTQLQKLIMSGETQLTRPFLVKLLEVLRCLQELRITIDTADLSLAEALRKCPKIQVLELIVRQYTPSFMARYLQNPLPSLRYLELCNFDENGTYNEEDKKAIEDACAKGMGIILDGF
ncbi:hypothetical protein NECID01_1502 [Nematocida sp. AWRm77]|nr:hypothetical protein NECID01_1502 [Nematocida sp. AWRm77]